MESKGSLPCSQEPTIGSYRDTLEPIHTLFKISFYFNVFFLSRSTCCC